MKLRPTDLRLLLVMLATVSALWVFAWVADEVGEGGTQVFDDAVIRWVREPDAPREVAGSTTLGEIARDVTALGSITVLTLVTTAVVGFLALSKLHRAVVLVLVAALGGTAWTFLLKELFARERPRLVADAIVSTTSFPSGHSALSAVVYLTLAALLARLVERRRLRAYIVGVAALVTFLVGVSRVALGVHFPSDVLAGWTLGLAWALFCWTAMTVLQRRGTVETVEEAHEHAHEAPG
ncbi:phosphatase PAP2 family protein [Sandaracinus amylolyticus]|uniref:Membrane-associated phospholipid phosphatase n=1 Tax=Sandaracinus amylolyticus TaxID=927083 RepID=A0A0F6W496_9BACT|nr:phosphatase PAP2 family protein [Sandaracinus amylolyticus]AKF07030.1 Membrane-associated phospholipid phosphatase [Sandaracinus amylolyticus]